MGKTRRNAMQASATELRQRLPGKVSEQWPTGERFVTAFTHGTMSVELYAPIDRDPQTPHLQDELYFIHSGSGELTIDGERHPCEAGMVFFVPAGVEHRFENFSSDFSTWVVFWGAQGGEQY
jgi:mannose-6-phosphate isomerase-like protein (cupin superfamily)